MKQCGSTGTPDAFVHDPNLTTGSRAHTFTFDTSGSTLKTGDRTFGYGTIAGVRLAPAGMPRRRSAVPIRNRFSIPAAR